MFARRALYLLGVLLACAGSSLSPTHANEPVIIVTETPRPFGRDAADFPATATPIVRVFPYGTGPFDDPVSRPTPSRGGPYGTGTVDTSLGAEKRLPLSDGVLIAAISVTVTGIITLLVALLTRRTQRETIIRDSRLGGDKFLLDKVGYLETQNSKLMERNAALEKENEQLRSSERKSDA